MILCDTDVIIEFFKGNESTKNIIEKEIYPKNVAISTINAMELYFGAKNKKELLIIKEFLSSFEIIKLNEFVADNPLNLIEKYSNYLILYLLWT